MEDITNTGVTPSSSKAKIKKVSLALLLEKYGPKKNKISREIEEEPKYHDNGFSVKFKLSHAFKALEKQEQTVAKPQLNEQPKLSARALRRLTAANPVILPQSPDNTCSSENNRLRTDLEKFSRIGKQKIQKCELVVKTAKQKQEEEYLGEGELKTNTKHKQIPLEFWRSLSKRKGRERDKVLEEQDYEDRTFITNSNLHPVLKNSKQHRKVGTTNHVSFSNDNKIHSIKPKHSPQLHRHQVFHGSKAVQEWEKRKRNRKQKKLDQKDKIKQAQNMTKLENSKLPDKKQTQHCSKSLSSRPISDGTASQLSNTSTRKRQKRKGRPKSAPSRSNPGKANINVAIGEYVHLSEWTKSLDTVFLDVPDTFEEPNLQLPQKVDKDKSSSDENVEEDVENEPELQYKPTQYLYDMCQCQQVSKLVTLKKLKKSEKPAGVIEIYGCDDNTGKFSCPFCSVFPHKRIQAWMEDVKFKTGLA